MKRRFDLMQCTPFVLYTQNKLHCLHRVNNGYVDRSVVVSMLQHPSINELISPKKEKETNLNQENLVGIDCE